jgi:dolichol-phosphate mannosyltransferase
MPNLMPSRPLVIIPTYNERENVTQLVPAVLAVDRRLEVLIIDDASPDDTAGGILKLKEKGCASRLHLKSRPGKLGLGSAYVQGFKWGLSKGYDFFIEMDADWSHDPQAIATMLQLAGKFDFVVGSRYVPGGGTLNWGTGRKLLSRCASIYARFVLRTHFADFTGGFNGWSRDVLNGIGLDGLRSDGYSFQIELKYRATQLGYTHVEFPISFAERRLGKSKMSFSIALEACWRVWQLRFHPIIQPIKNSEGPALTIDD